MQPWWAKDTSYTFKKKTVLIPKTIELVVRARFNVSLLKQSLISYMLIVQ